MKSDPQINLTFSPDEATEVMNLVEVILRDNVLEGGQFLRGVDLVKKCLLYNDPENFGEKNEQRVQTVQEILQIQGAGTKSFVGTYEEAEVEYRYLKRVADIYLKLYEAAHAGV